MLKHLILWPLAAFALLQLIQIRIPDAPAHLDPGKEIHAPKEIQALLERSCYDCHSYRTNMPWYGHIAPFSFEVKSHIKNGRLAVNFQEWGEYDEAKKQRIYRGIVKTIEGRMPLPMYLDAHPEAQLSAQERAKIKAWAQSHIKEQY
jgi:hypothetical protein